MAALPPGQAVVAVGNPALTARYQRALAAQGHAVRCVGAEAGWAGLRALAYTVNETASAERLIGLGLDGLITDRIDRFDPERRMST